MFKGIPADAFDFFEELAADNTKAWWTDNKARYESSVRGPVEALLNELADEFGPGKLFRPYRDVRFSKDKTPYKTNLGATTSSNDGSIYYLALMPEGMYLGSGYYHMSKDQLERFRVAVADRAGAQLAAAVAKLEKAGYEVGGDQLKRVPRGFDADHERARFLRHKGLYVGRQFEPAAWMGTKKKARDRVATTWRALAPVNNWLNRHVGPATEE